MNLREILVRAYPLAQKVSALTRGEDQGMVTGIRPLVALCQHIWETGWEQSWAWVHLNNPAGISPAGHLAYYPTDEDGIAAWAAVLRHPLYAAVLAAWESGDEAQIRALGQSPWSESHYVGEGADPGDGLIALYRDNVLPWFQAGGGGVPEGQRTPRYRIPLTVDRAADELLMRLTAGKNEPQAPVVFLLDTGAFEILVAGRDQQVLGLPNLGGESVAGIGGRAQAFASEIAFLVGGDTFRAPCVVDPSEQGPSLFGLKWILDQGFDFEVDFAHDPAAADLLLYAGE